MSRATNCCLSARTQSGKTPSRDDVDDDDDYDDDNDDDDDDAKLTNYNGDKHDNACLTQSGKTFPLHDYDHDHDHC